MGHKTHFISILHYYIPCARIFYESQSSGRGLVRLWCHKKSELIPFPFLIPLSKIVQQGILFPPGSCLQKQTQEWRGKMLENTNNKHEKPHIALALFTKQVYFLSLGVMNCHLLFLFTVCTTKVSRMCNTNELLISWATSQDSLWIISGQQFHIPGFILYSISCWIRSLIWGFFQFFNCFVFQHLGFIYASFSIPLLMKKTPVSTITYVHSVFLQFLLHLKYVYVWVAAGLPAWDTGSEVEKQSKNNVIFSTFVINQTLGVWFLSLILIIWLCFQSSHMGSK